MADQQQKLMYPSTRTVDQVDDYHGVTVADPYRWLEDLNSEETKAWVAAQNGLTSSYLAAIPARDRIRQRLTELWNYERYDGLFKRGGRYFFLKNDGLQNQSILYTMTSLNDEPRVLLDPNLLSEDGTVALTGLGISEDGRFMAYGLSSSGSDWQEWKVRDLETGQDLPDCLRWIKFTNVSWTSDGRGFFYNRYDEPEEKSKFTVPTAFQKLFYHRIGTRQSGDLLIYERPDQKDWGFFGSVTEDGRYLIITVWRGNDPKYGVFYKDLADPDAPVVELLNDFDAGYIFIDNDGPRFWFRTDLDAPRGRVIAIDIQHPERSHWQEIIPEAVETLQNVTLVHNQFITSYLKDACTQVKIFSLDGKYEHEVELPGLGTAVGFEGKRMDNETFYSFTSFTTPTTCYRYDMVKEKSTAFRPPTLNVNPDGFETRQVFYSSKDGTRVPMFLVHKKGLPLDGTNPTILYGYGGFNIPLTPLFIEWVPLWMDLGGVFAMANLRGGSEYGEAWHQAGVRHNKQNVFDDFVAAAEWLITNRYTCSSKLAILGGSNGGLLVGACLTQRPELFGAALPSVGVFDMLRYHQFTIGALCVPEYGSPDNPEEWKTLYAYSPLHNVRPGTAYPATLLTTADHDDRVVPLHSYKFTAALQAVQTDSAPILLRVDTKAGHGVGTPTAKLIEWSVDMLAFLLRPLQIDVPAGRE